MTKALNENALKHLIASSFSLNDVVDAHEEVERTKMLGMYCFLLQSSAKQLTYLHC